MRRASYTRAACAVVLAGSVVLVVAGCGADAPAASPPTSGVGRVGDPGPSATTPVTTRPAATTTKWPKEQQDVLDALNRALAARDEAAASGSPFTHGMASTHVDPYLSRVQTRIFDRARAGQRARYPEQSVNKVEPISVVMDGDRAVVAACSIDDAVIYEVDTGNVVNADVSTALVRYLLLRIDETWKVSEYEITSRKNGASTCDDLS
jgi:hypothetical protein